MRGFSFRFIFVVVTMMGALASADPQAHWQSSSQIQLYYQTLKSPTGMQFQLVSGDGTQTHNLPLITRRGDMWSLSTMDLTDSLPTWVRQAGWVRALDAQGDEVMRTTLRMNGVLDEAFADPSRAWGLTWNGGTPTLRLWAPTAQRVQLLIFSDADAPSPTVVPMQLEDKGFWSAQGDYSWKGQYYLYRVTLFSPFSGEVETFDVTDPLSVTLSADGARSQIIDPDDGDWKPAGWDYAQKPPLEHLTDSVIYELHLRDFTANDGGLQPNEKGTYGGLANPNSLAYQHLKELADAGITHVHFLPLLDFAAVGEKRDDQATASISAGSASSSYPQQQIGAIRNRDAYNWGYNPVHWMAPEGSYAQDPDGGERILEMRTMIKAMNDAGLRVVLDVVFNHTYSSGIEDFSVFDRIVPAYYYRYNDQGQMMNSSCCADVATENTMVEKLILDSLVYLARTYRVDGFRFDLMNLHPADQVARIQQALSQMTLQREGIDGPNLLLYAEAWPFGSLEELHPGTAFTQLRSYGLGMGVFNDRLRDALRGGSTDSGKKSDQGFATGLYWDFNREPANTDTPTDAESQRQNLLVLNDVVKIGMAGNLRDFNIRDHLNNSVSGGSYYFRNQPVGYAAEPTETISYVSSHDGYCLWDAVQAKLPFQNPDRQPPTATAQDRVRTQDLMLGTVLLSQGIPFIEGGSELLRSKSGDVDSYDSGDWFNQIDWSRGSNNWGVGLPAAWDNQGDWNFWQPRLNNSDLQVGNTEINTSNDVFKALLSLRRGHRLLRLASTAEIRRTLTFPVDEITGSEIPGFLALFFDDENSDIDVEHRAMAVFINASTQPQSYRSHLLADRQWQWPAEFGPAQDPTLNQATWQADGSFVVPARSVMVLEEPR